MKNEANEQTVETNMEEQHVQNESTMVEKLNEDIRVLHKKVKRINILNYVTIALLIIVILSKFINIEVTTGSTHTASPVTSNEANQIMSEIMESYNQDNSDTLYALFGDYVKANMSLDKFNQQFEVIKFVGKIHYATYSDYTYANSEGNVDWYILHYDASYENGEGTATITIRAIDDEWEVAGFNFHIDDIASDT